MNTYEPGPRAATAAPEGAAKRPWREMFILPDGRNVAFTFTIVSSLFLIWGFCNGMIDVMDKHFQRELHLSLSQSAWVQFAHWMGYFLMSLPAGWLTIKLGYKSGIISGLLLVTLGGIWFIEATHLARFWFYLLGVCIIASGLTFLETIANPYTTVLGARRFSASRINLAQSCNGVGWVLGPIAGSMFFYAKNAQGEEMGSTTLWVPYAGVAIVVALLAVVFFFSPVPDIQTEDDYHLDDKSAGSGSPAAGRKINYRPVYWLLLANVAALVGVLGMILWVILNGLKMGSKLMDFAAKLPHPGGPELTDEAALVVVLCWAGLLAVAIAALVLPPVVKRLSHQSIWSHEHFSGAALAQFFYVAAQTCIFAFFINYMTAEPPAIPDTWGKAVPNWLQGSVALTVDDLKHFPSLASKLKQPQRPIDVWLASQLSDKDRAALTNYPAKGPSPVELYLALKTLTEGKHLTADDKAALTVYETNAPSPADLEKAFKTLTQGRQILDQAKAVLAAYTAEGPPPAELQMAILKQINTNVIAKGAAIHDAQRFTGISLRPETQSLLAQQPTGKSLQRLNRLLLEDAYPTEISRNWLHYALETGNKDGLLHISNAAASTLSSVAFLFFLAGRVKGAQLLRKLSAHKVVGLYALLNIAITFLVYLKLGWFSVACVFLSYYFMSIMFPTIFALGIFGLGVRAKRASAYIVMGIVGGAIIPKLMGAIADQSNVSRGFIVPMLCFFVIAFYGFCWPKLSKAPSLHGLKPAGGH